MAIVLDGSAGITNDGGYTGDGVVFADTTPANTLVTTTGGNVGVGTSSPTDKLSLYSTTSVYQRFQNSTTGTGAADGFQLGNDATGAYVWNYEATPIVFATGGTARAQIDSSGNLLVGTTTPRGRLTAAGVAGANAFNFFHTTTGDGVGVISQDNAAFTSGAFAINCATAAGTGYRFLECFSGNFSSLRFQILGNGNAQNANNSYGAISDSKLKENVTDATPKLEKLQQVRVVNYNLIGDEQKQIGVIAQELEQVFPGMVEESPDRDKEGNDLGTTTKAVKYSVFVPMLIKAIQEQQQLITALTARVAALEGTQP